MDINAKLRPMYIAKILHEQTDEDHFLTTAQLADILQTEYGIETYRKTIKSDIEALQQFGLDIEIIRASQNKYHMLTRMFSVPELKLLADAVESSKFVTKKKSSELTEKLARLAGKYQAEELIRNIDVEDRIKTENEQIYYIVDTVNTAINRGKKISFQYFKYNEHKEKELKNDGVHYVFSPYKLVWNGDYYYMVGYSDKHNGIGTFRIDRVLRDPDILEEDAVLPPEDFDINRYLNTMFRMFDGDRKTVRLICDNTVIDSIIDRFGDRVKIRKNTKATSIVTIDVVVSHIFLSWVFGFSGKVQIKGPQCVKDRYISMLQSELRIYGNVNVSDENKSEIHSSTELLEIHPAK